MGPNIRLAAEDLPAVSQLDGFLAKARHFDRDYHGLTSSLFELFGFSREPGQDFPSAAVSRLSDAEDYPEGVWLRADPVHLTADRDGVVLMDHNVFDINQHDALAIAAEIRGLFESEDMELEVPVPTRWYLHLKNPAAIQTHEISRVVGRNIQPFLPHGDDKAGWHRLLNEIQMTLHDAEINQQRQNRGLLAINSVWFWGMGKLPDLCPRVWSKVYADDDVTRGLAMLSATPFTELPDDISEIDIEQENISCLVVISAGVRFTQYNEPEKWAGFLQELEAKWFIGLESLLKSGFLQQVVIITEQGTFKLKKSSLLKFWRQHYLYQLNQQR